MTKAFDLYADGGVISVNPSPYGGTWSWVLVDERQRRIEYDAGVILPTEYNKQKISNNLSELYAVVKALEAMPVEWCGTIYTDSKVTVNRLAGSTKFNGIPKSLMDRCLRLRRNRKWQVKHIGGHPTRREIADGFDKRGLPVSVFNVFVDLMCKREASLYLERLHHEKGRVA